MTAAPPTGATPALAHGSRPLTTGARAGSAIGGGQPERFTASTPERGHRSVHRTLARVGRSLAGRLILKVASGLITAYVLAHLDQLMDFLLKVRGATP